MWESLRTTLKALFSQESDYKEMLEWVLKYQKEFVLLSKPVTHDQTFFYAYKIDDISYFISREHFEYFPMCMLPIGYGYGAATFSGLRTGALVCYNERTHCEVGFNRDVNSAQLQQKHVSLKDEMKAGYPNLGGVSGKRERYKNQAKPRHPSEGADSLLSSMRKRWARKDMADYKTSGGKSRKNDDKAQYQRFQSLRYSETIVLPKHLKKMSEGVDHKAMLAELSHIIFTEAVKGGATLGNMLWAVVMQYNMLQTQQHYLPIHIYDHRTGSHTLLPEAQLRFFYSLLPLHASLSEDQLKFNIFHTSSNYDLLSNEIGKTILPQLLIDETLVNAALKFKDKTLARYLLSHCAPRADNSCVELSILYEIASSQESTALLERILNENSLNLNKQQLPDTGNFALHQAVVVKNVPLVKLLIRKGADRGLMNNQGLTPFELAGNDLNLIDAIVITQQEIPSVKPTDAKKVIPSGASFFNSQLVRIPRINLEEGLAAKDLADLLKENTKLTSLYPVSNDIGALPASLAMSKSKDSDNKAVVRDAKKNIDDEETEPGMLILARTFPQFNWTPSQDTPSTYELTLKEKDAYKHVFSAYNLKEKLQLSFRTHSIPIEVSVQETPHGVTLSLTGANDKALALLYKKEGCYNRINDQDIHPTQEQKDKLLTDLHAEDVPACINLFKTITKLKIGSLSEAAWITLFKALLDNKIILRSLELYTNTIKPELYRDLSTALCLNQSLISLVFIPDFTCPNIYKMGRKGAIHLAPMLTSNNNLKLLSIQDNEICKEGAEAIADALRLNKTLKVLDLHGNYIVDEGARCLGALLPKNHSLISLQLSRNGISEKGAIALWEALELNSVLASLNLENNQIDDGGVTTLAKQCRLISLQKLNLADNLIEEESINVLANLIKQNTTLTELRLGRLESSSPYKCITSVLAINSIISLLIEASQLSSTLSNLIISYLMAESEVSESSDYKMPVSNSRLSSVHSKFFEASLARDPMLQESSSQEVSSVIGLIGMG